jgi:hypothetical protein
MADLLSQLFATAGNVLHATPTGFRTSHEPVHVSSSGTCVNIDAAQAVWYCFNCQQGGGVVEAVMSLQGLTRDEAEAQVQAQGGQATGAASDDRVPLADRLIAGALRRVDLFQDEYGEPWAIVPVGAHKETLSLTARPFRRWLAHAFYTATGKSPNAEAMSQALLVLEGRAVHEGPTRHLAWRIAQHGNTFLYDLVLRFINVCRVRQPKIPPGPCRDS